MVERSTTGIRSLGDRPSATALWLSAFVHLAALALIFVARQVAPARIVPPKYESAQLVRRTARVSVPQRSAPSHATPVQMKRHARLAHKPEQVVTQNGTGGEALREQAQRETAAMVHSFKFRAIYGFYPGFTYRLAVQTAGEIPSISADQVPPHFQQFVVVEVTIDAEGRVADARIVTGIVEPPIQQTLLSAIREFKYTPATRDGVPIPSQLDIVIHIPNG